MKKNIFHIMTLSYPLMLTQGVHALFNFLCIAIIAHLGKDVLAASALVMQIYRVLIVLFWGFLNSISVIVSEEHGKKSVDQLEKILVNGIWLGVFVSLFLSIFIYYSPAALTLTHQDPKIIEIGHEYLHAVLFAALPGTLLIVIEQYLMGLKKVKIVLLIALLQIPAQLICTYFLVFGSSWFSGFGIAGIGYAMFTTYTVIASGFIGYLFKTKHLSIKNMFKINIDLIKQLLSIGCPIGFMYLSELAIFLVVAFFMSQFSISILAAQQISIQYMELTFMFLFGFSQAITVAVAYSLGEKNIADVKHFIKSGVLIAVLSMSFVFLMYLFFGKYFVSFDVGNLSNIHEFNFYEIAISLLLITGVFQIFESVRIVLSSVLRAMKDTLKVFYYTSIAFWIIGLPIMYWLGFILNLQAMGVWLGLILTSIVGSIFLYYRLSQFLKKTTFLKSDYPRNGGCERMRSVID